MMRFLRFVALLKPVWASNFPHPAVFVEDAWYPWNADLVGGFSPLDLKNISQNGNLPQVGVKKKIKPPPSDDQIFRIPNQKCLNYKRNRVHNIIILHNIAFNSKILVSNHPTDWGYHTKSGFNSGSDCLLKQKELIHFTKAVGQVSSMVKPGKMASMFSNLATFFIFAYIYFILFLFLWTYVIHHICWESAR